MPCRAEKLALTKANSPSTGGHLFDAPILHPPRPPARDLITEIPDGAILEAIRAEVRWAVRRAPLHSLVLTACRAWLYAAEGRFASKQDAADWAAQRYPHASLIRAAVARQQGERGIRINRSAAERLATHVDSVLAAQAS